MKGGDPFIQELMRSDGSFCVMGISKALGRTTHPPVNQDKGRNGASALFPCGSGAWFGLGLRMRKEGLWLRHCLVF